MGLRWLRDVSLQKVLGAVLGLGLIMLMGFGADTITRALSRQGEAQRVVQMAEASRMLFTTATSLRLERGEALTALNGPAPDPDSPRIQGPRADGVASIAGAPAALRALGREAEAARVERGVAAVQALRPRIDAALRLPREGRDAALTRAWAETTLAHIDDLLAITTAVEDASILSNPHVDRLIALRRMGWQLRSALGDVLLNSIVAMGNNRGFTPQEAGAAWRNQGQAVAAWGVLQAAAARPDLPVALRDAILRAAPSITGPIGAERDATLATLAEGRPAGGDFVPFRDRQVPSVPILTAIPVAALDAMVAEARAEAASAAWALALGSVLIAMALAISLGGLWATRRLVAQPIRAMTGVMQKLAARDYAVEVPMQGWRNEIGAMASAVQAFRQGLETAERLAEAQRAEQQARLARGARIDSLTAAFEQQIDGVTTMLAEAAGKLEASATGMTDAARHGTQEASAIARAAHEADGGVQSVAAAAEELAASIAEISRQIGQSQSVVRAAVTEADRTDRVVRDLSEGAGRISEVVTLIRNIAAQTNLLALNATIEAARAGEAGKGFAVVAGEVKTLAAQTAKATEEIGAQIGQIQTATQEAVSAIGSIAGTVGQVAEITGAIAAAVEQQEAATRGISANVQAVAAGTAQVTAGVGAVTTLAEDTGGRAAEVLDAAGQLNRQAAATRGEVGRFLAEVKAA